jgi:hypothetical protein
VKTIKITTLRGKHSQPVKAHVFGTWAAHLGYSEPGWTVTDVKSGLACVHWLDEEDAIAAARRLAGTIEVPRVTGSIDDLRSGRGEYPVGYDKHELRFLIEATIAEAMHP